MSVIQFHLKLSWRNSMQAGDTSMTLRLKNYFHMTRIITEDWKLMMRWLHVQVLAKGLASLIFVQV